MDTMKVWAVEGRLILRPEAEFQPVPAEGVVVTVSSYYTSAVRDGDITDVDPAARSNRPQPAAVMRQPAPDSRSE